MGVRSRPRVISVEQVVFGQAVKIRTGCFQASHIQTTYGFGAWKHPLRALPYDEIMGRGKMNTQTLNVAGVGTMRLGLFVSRSSLFCAHAVGLRH